MPQLYGNEFSKFVESFTLRMKIHKKQTQDKKLEDSFALALTATSTKADPSSPFRA